MKSTLRRIGVALFICLISGAGGLSAQKSGQTEAGGGEAEWHCYTCESNACPNQPSMSWYIKDDTPPYGPFGRPENQPSFCATGSCPNPGVCVPLLAARTQSAEAIDRLAHMDLNDIAALRALVRTNGAVRVNLERGALQVTNCAGTGAVVSVNLPKAILSKLTSASPAQVVGRTPLRMTFSAI